MRWLSSAMSTVRLPLFASAELVERRVSPPVPHMRRCLRGQVSPRSNADAGRPSAKLGCLLENHQLNRSPEVAAGHLVRATGRIKRDDV